MSFNVSLQKPLVSRTRQFCRHGFSLMEMMVVLLIIGLITTAVTVGVRRAMSKGQNGIAETEINNIVSGLDLYAAEAGRYPTQAEGLDVLIKPIGDEVFPILDKPGSLTDPWGNPYLYIVTNDKKQPIEVISNGADGREGTEDDISSLSDEE